MPTRLHFQKPWRAEESCNKSKEVAAVRRGMRRVEENCGRSQRIAAVRRRLRQTEGNCGRSQRITAGQRKSQQFKFMEMGSDYT